MKERGNAANAWLVQQKVGALTLASGSDCRGLEGGRGGIEAGTHLWVHCICTIVQPPAVALAQAPAVAGPC